MDTVVVFVTAAPSALGVGEAASCCSLSSCVCDDGVAAAAFAVLWEAIIAAAVGSTDTSKTSSTVVATAVSFVLAATVDDVFDVSVDRRGHSGLVRFGRASMRRQALQHVAENAECAVRTEDSRELLHGRERSERGRCAHLALRLGRAQEHRHLPQHGAILRLFLEALDRL